MDRWEEAIKSYSRQLEVEGATSKALNNRAFCKAKLNQFSDAILDYTKAFQVDPGNFHALHNRGICLQRTGLFTEVHLANQGHQRFHLTDREKQ